MLSRTFFFAVFNFICFSLQSQNARFCKGYIITGSGEVVSGANIFVDGLPKAVSDDKGYFSFEMPEKSVFELKITSVGFVPLTKKADLASDFSDAEKFMLDEDLLNVNQIVVSASRNEENRKDAVVMCNILENKVLQATQSVSLSEGLNFQPALRTETNCQNCGFTSLRMNGLEGAYSQVLMDGRPVFGSLQSVYGLEQIPANMIERVEIVRGGGSSLYGSSAVAGTVNIVTRVPRGKQFFFAKQFSMTNFQAPEINLSGGKSFENNEGTFGAVIYANYRNRSAWDANGDEFSEITKIKAKSAGYKAFLKFSERKRLDFQGYVMQEYRRGGDVTNRKPHETPLAEELLHKIYNSGVSFEMMSNDKKSKFSIYNTTQFIRRDSYYGSGQIDAYGLTDDLTSTSGMQFSQFLSKFLGGESVLTAGAEANINRLNDHILAVGRSLMQRANFFAIYVQNDWTISERLKLLTGGRIDRQNLLQKAVFCPRVSLLYNAGENLQFRTGYARGFRAPQVFNEDLHISQAGGVLLRIVNSEKLKPEFSDSFTFSGDYLRQEENFAFGITADFFCTRLKNVFTLNESGRDDFGNLLLIKQNGSGARVFGVSLNPKLVFKNAFEMQSGLTFQRSLHDEKIYWSATATAVRKFLRTPDLYGFYTLTSNFSKKITVSLSGVLTGRMYVPHFKGYIENDVLKKTPAFFEQNFKVSRAFRGNNSTFELFTGLQNAFNSYQKDFDLGAERDAGYLYGASRPRVFFVGMRADF